MLLRCGYVHERRAKFGFLQIKRIHHVALSQPVDLIVVRLIFQCLRLLVELLKLANLVQLEEVVVFSLLQVLRVLIRVIARIQTLLLRLELDSVLMVRLLLLLTEEQVHRHLQLVDLINRDLSLRLRL